MDRKIRVGAVSYLNTKPLVWGFEQGGMKDQVDLSFEYPSLLGEKLANDEIDIGLIPVASMKNVPAARIISNFCIGASGPVASVCLFSEVPLTEINTILLDYQSSSSVALLKILLKNHWHIFPELKETTGGYENEVKKNTAALIIGDRAFTARKKYSYIYDLAEEWQKMTGLPFVFAAWVANKELPGSFISEFNLTTAAGLTQLQEIVSEHQHSNYDLMNYYTENIDYHLDERKKKALTLFLEYESKL